MWFICLLNKSHKCQMLIRITILNHRPINSFPFYTKWGLCLCFVLDLLSDVWNVFYLFLNAKHQEPQMPGCWEDVTFVRQLFSKQSVCQVFIFIVTTLRCSHVPIHSLPARHGCDYVSLLQPPVHLCNDQELQHVHQKLISNPSRDTTEEVVRL